jgi:hypothetical protein
MTQTIWQSTDRKLTVKAKVELRPMQCGLRTLGESIYYGSLIFEEKTMHGKRRLSEMIGGTRFQFEDALADTLNHFQHAARMHSTIAA